MSGGLAPESVFRICEHMNADHADALATYARFYAGIEDVTAARLVALDARGMDLSVDTTHGTVGSRIAFDHLVKDSNDARATLIAMAAVAAEKEDS